MKNGSQPGLMARKKPEVQAIWAAWFSEGMVACQSQNCAEEVLCFIQLFHKRILSTYYIPWLMLSSPLLFSVSGLAAVYLSASFLTLTILPPYIRTCVTALGPPG